MNIEQRINEYVILLISPTKVMLFIHNISFKKILCISFLCEFENKMLQSFLAVFFDIFKELFENHQILFHFENILNYDNFIND